MNTIIMSSELKAIASKLIQFKLRLIFIKLLEFFDTINYYDIIDYSSSLKTTALFYN